MADGEIRAKRVVLRTGMVCVCGHGYRNLDLIGHAGEVVDVIAPEKGSDQVTVIAGDERFYATLVEDFTDNLRF